MDKIKLKASPVGVFSLIFVDRPSQKFDNYSAKLVIEPGSKDREGRTVEQLHAFMEAKLDEYVKEIQKEKPKAKKFRRKLPLLKQEDAEGNETGKWELRASQKATIKFKDGEVKHLRVANFDSKGKQFTGIAIGRGSTGRLGGTLHFYVNDAAETVGIGMYLEGTQILNLVPPGEKDASDFGFGEEEGGFTFGDADLTGETDVPAEGAETADGPAATNF